MNTIYETLYMNIHIYENKILLIKIKMSKTGKMP